MNKFYKVAMLAIKSSPQIYRYLLIFFAGFLVVICGIAALVEDKSGYLIGNIFPELIGFGLEGLFFIVIFSLYSVNAEQKKKQRESENSKRLVLGIVNGYTSHIGKLIQPGATFNLSVPMMRESLYSLIEEKWNKNESTKSEILLLTKSFLPIFEQHLVTACKVDSTHSETWQHIVIYLNYCILNENEIEAWNSFVKAIQEMKGWDALEIGREA